jgi:hypothetical protein
MPRPYRSQKNKLVPTLFFSAFLLGMSVVFYHVFGRSLYFETRAFLLFREQTCLLQRIDVVHTANTRAPYSVDVQFSGTFDGKDFTSRQFCPVSEACQWFSYEAAQHALSAFQQNSNVSCFVDPAHLERTVLVRTTSSYTFMLLVPLLLYAVALAGLYDAWIGFPWPAASKGAEAENLRAQQGTSLSFGQIEPVGRQIPQPTQYYTWPQLVAGLLIGSAFCAPFLFGGLKILDQVYFQPQHNIEEAKNWQETRCTILISSVKMYHNPNSHGRSMYSPDVVYGYSVAGQSYRASRLSFHALSANVRLRSKAQMEALAAQYPLGSTVPCYFDPRDPSRAVLDRTTGPTNEDLIPLIFVLVGGGGLCFVFGAIGRIIYRQQKASGM